MSESEYHPAPEWLTECYLEAVLRKNKADPELKVINVTVTPVTAKGENYASIMTRVKVEFLLSGSKTALQESYIAKTTLENDPLVTSIMQPYEVTQTEMLMYEKVLPKLTALLQELGEEQKVFAHTIHVDYEHGAIIFEDLAVSNYVMADRLAGMDMALAKLTLEKLAKMHATAAVLNERQPGLLTKFERGIFNRHTNGFAPLFENIVEEAAHFSGDCAQLGNYFKDKLLLLKTRVMEYGARVHDAHKSYFMTLSHGDFWVNNVMLRYADNTSKIAQDMILIDFQFSNWSSPAVDLHYFFNTSLKSELRFQQQDVLVQYYHHILVDTLQKLQFKGFIPTLHQLVVQLELGHFYAVISSLVCQPIMLNDQNADADFRALVSDDERGRNFRKGLFANKNIQCNIRRILPYLDRRGLLDAAD